MKKKLMIPAGLHLLTLSYNINTALLYFGSADNFASHMGYTNDRLTSLNCAWELPVLIGVSVCDFVLFLSNQVVFPKRLEKMFCRTDSSHEHSNIATKILRSTSSSITGLFKAIVMSSSLLALLNSLVGLNIGLAITLALLPGNLLAELSMFFEPYLEKLTFLKSQTFNRWFARYCGLAYSVCNGALYFNAIDLAPKDIGWLNERMIEERSPVGIAVLVVYVLASLQFTYATYNAFTRRIDVVLNEKRKLSIEETNPLLAPPPVRFRERCTASTVAASLWKTIVTSLELIALSHIYDVPEIGYPIAIALFLGNFFSQLTLYARDDAEVRNSKSWCSFFSGCCAKSERTVLPEYSPSMS